MLNMEQHYRELIRAYMRDHTEEGMVAKQAAMREAEFILREYFGCPQDHLNNIFDQEYLKEYHPETKQIARPFNDLDEKLYKVMDDLRFNPVREDLENALGEANLDSEDEGNLERLCDKLAKKTPMIAEEIVELVHEKLFEAAKELKEGKIEIKFEGGEASDGIRGCNYMLGRYKDADGYEQKLYAEVRTPDDWDGIDPDNIPQEEVDKFDDESYQCLKDEIISQAKAAGISEDRLLFP